MSLDKTKKADDKTINKLKSSIGRCRAESISSILLMEPHNPKIPEESGSCFLRKLRQCPRKVKDIDKEVILLIVE